MGFEVETKAQRAERTARISAEACARAKSLIARLEAKGFTKNQAEFAVMPIERLGLTTVGDVRAFLEKTRPGLFRDPWQTSLFEEGAF